MRPCEIGFCTQHSACEMRSGSCMYHVRFFHAEYSHSVMYHSWTIFPLEGHLGFWFGAVTNKASVNISYTGFLVWILS